MNLFSELGRVFQVQHNSPIAVRVNRFCFTFYTTPMAYSQESLQPCGSILEFHDDDDGSYRYLASLLNKHKTVSRCPSRME